MPPYVLVNRASGFITKGDLTVSPVVDTDIATGGSVGWGSEVGPDNCGYFTQSDRVLKVTNADGSCGLAPPILAPRVTLAPASIRNPAQGTSTSVTATVTNIGDPTGQAVTFVVTGANTQSKLVRAGADGTATFTYTGTSTGNDTVSAFTTVADSTIQSGSTALTWTAGKHTTFLSLDLSPTSAIAGASVTVVASLADVSVTPAAALAGVPIQFSLAGQTCTATTNAAGQASCALPAGSAAGHYPLSASFAGNGQYLGDQASIGFAVTGDAPPPEPTATLTPTPTATPVPGAPAAGCIPRPNVTVQVVEDRPNHLNVTLTAGAIPGSFVNVIRTVRFGAPVNATIDVGAQTNQRSPFNVSPPGGVPTFVFGVNRLQAGQPYTVPLVIADNYGDFPTFVGNGHADAAPSGPVEFLRGMLGLNGASEAAVMVPPSSTAQANPGNDCVARPDVQVQVTPDRPGRLKVTVTAASIAPAPGNLIWSIRLGAGANAIIDDATHTGASGPFTVTSANGMASYTFFVNRVTAGQAATVPLTIVDYYGEFPTVVGGGPSAF